MDAVSLNTQLEDLQKRITQSESAHGAAHLSTSLLNIALEAYPLTTIPATASIAFYNSIPMSFELMQALVTETIGKIYSQILMTLAALLDPTTTITDIGKDLVNKGITSADQYINSSITNVNNQIDSTTAQITQLGTQITSLTNTLNNTTDPAQRASLTAQITAATSQKNMLSNTVLPTLQKQVLGTLQTQLSSSINKANPLNIFMTQLKLSQGVSNSLKIQK